MRIPDKHRRTAAIAAAVFLCALLVVVIALPPRHRATTGAPDTVWPGVFHVHSTESDGGGTRADIARAAADAGLRFVILTDHGDGTRPPHPPEYVDGVLVIDGVEIGTRDGHYAAFGLRQSPYPLGGPASAVVEDVARLGGFGAAAHPRSAKRDLRWRRDGPEAFVDGYEVINGDSAWRDESALSLIRTMIGYPFRPPGALAQLIEPPRGDLEWIDRANRARRVVALAGADAHGRLPLSYDDGEEESEGWALPIPSYKQSFRAVANVVDVGRAPSQDAEADAAALLAAVRAGRVTVAVAALAAPASLAFTARTDDGMQVAMGDRMLAAPVTFEARVSDVVVRGGSAVRLRLLRDGQVVSDVAGPVLTHREEQAPAGIWRVEATLAAEPDIPWLIGNPIAVVAPDWITPASPRFDFPSASLDLTPGPWAVEKHATSEASVTPTGDEEATGEAGRTANEPAGDEGVTFTYHLAGGVPSGQYAAAVREVGSDEAWSHVVLRARAPQPTRLWVQLRLSDSASGQRWGRSVYLDRFSREVRLALNEFLPLESGRSSRPHQARIQSVLIVIDTVNSAPGRAGEVVIEQLQVLSSDRQE